MNGDLMFEEEHFLTEDNIEVRIKCYIQDRIIIKNLHVQLNNAKILAVPAGMDCIYPDSIRMAGIWYLYIFNRNCL